MRTTQMEVVQKHFTHSIIKNMEIEQGSTFLKAKLIN